MQKILSLIIIMLVNSLQSQVCIIISSLPQDTDPKASFYLASSLNNWNAKDEEYQFKINGVGKPELCLQNINEIVEFKITQGNWELSEADREGNKIANHKLDFSKTKIAEISIENWTSTNGSHEMAHTLSGNVRILNEHFKVPQLATTRRVWLYLPPDYRNSRKRYPVIYMHDGQNLFDNATSFSGEWGVDETMQQFAKNHQIEAIVVGIDNGGDERLNEYSPWENEKYKKGGKGNLYLKFLVNTLKPFIDSTYRTKPQAKNTALIGSSMGGLISFYGGVKYPKVFGKIGVFSPSFWFSSKDLKAFLNQAHHDLQQSKFYFVAGAHEGDCMPEEIAKVEKRMLDYIPASNILTKIDEDGTHSEGYWKREFGNAILWLFDIE